MTQCPSDERLARLLDEQLSGDDLATVEHHLEACERCQQILEELTSERFSATEWRSAGDSATTGSVANRDAPAGDPKPDDSGLFNSDLLAGQEQRRKRLILESSPRHPSSFQAHDGDHRDAGGSGGASATYPPQIDGYDIVGRLGRGGMGVVYRARQHGLDRLVALKMLRGGVHADPESLARFRIEVRAVARLRHHNVVQVFDVGESQGLPYVALELLEGGSLEAKNGGTPQPEAAAAALVATLARAIASAHEVGIVHRDLKPANVLFSRDGVPKITDFGLAKRLDEDDGQTYSGQVMGSPSFMAPEQARGGGREVGPAADIYSLGAILYEMISGRPPFKGGSPLETLHQVLHVEPVPPSKLRPGLSRDLETICLKTLSKEPAQRYATADQLASDLDRFLAGAPIAARRTLAIERAWKWTRREPAAASLVGLVAVAVLVAVGVGLRTADASKVRARQIQTVRGQGPAVFLRATAALHEQRWGAGRDALQDYLQTLGSGPDLTDLRRQAETLLAQIRQAEAAEKDRREARAHLERFREQTHRAQLSDAHWLLSRNQPGSDPRPVRQAAQESLALMGQVATDPAHRPESWRRGDPSPWLEPGENAEVDLACRELVLLWVAAIGQPAPGENARDQTDRALAILGRWEANRPTSQAACLLRASLLARRGDLQAAEQARHQAAAMTATDALDHVAAGHEFHLAGDWSRATEEYEDALRRDPNQFRAQLALAICQIQTARPEAARVGLTACLQRQPRSIDLLSLRGLATGEVASLPVRPGEATGRASAEALFRAAEADFETVLSLRPGLPEMVTLLVNRGIVRVRAARYRDAEADFAEAVRRAPTHLAARVNWGQTLHRLGRIDDAITQFTWAIEAEPERASLYRARALARLARRDTADEASQTQARQDLDESIRLSRPGSPEVADDYCRRARLLHRGGQFIAALADSDEALRIKPSAPEDTLVRIQTLLELKRYPEVIRTCDQALIQRPAAAELWELRGVARSDCQEFAAAVGDLTQALTLEPGRSSARLQRGWAYLVSEAPKLALADFEAAIQQAPENAEAYGGRGFALALAGQDRAATADAEESLRKARPGDARIVYNAARIYARAAEGVTAGPANRRASVSFARADEYQGRALALIQQAIESLPADRRLRFARDVVRSDPALATIRQRPRFARLIGQTGGPTP